MYIYQKGGGVYADAKEEMLQIWGVGWGEEGDSEESEREER